MTTLVCNIPERLDARLKKLARQAKLPKEKFVRKAHRVLHLPATALPLPSEPAGTPVLSAPHDYGAELGALSERPAGTATSARILED